MRNDEEQVALGEKNREREEDDAEVGTHTKSSITGSQRGLKLMNSIPIR